MTQFQTVQDVVRAWEGRRVGSGSAMMLVASVIDVSRLDAEIASLPEDLREPFVEWARAMAAAAEPLPEPIGSPPPMAPGLIPALRAWAVRAQPAAAE